MYLFESIFICSICLQCICFSYTQTYIHTHVCMQTNIQTYINTHTGIPKNMHTYSRLLFNTKICININICGIHNINEDTCTKKIINNTMNMPYWLQEGLLFSRLPSQEDCIQFISFTLLCYCSFQEVPIFCCYFAWCFFCISLLGTVVKSLPSCLETDSLLVPLAVSLRLVIKKGRVKPPCTSSGGSPLEGRNQV